MQKTENMRAFNALKHEMLVLLRSCVCLDGYLHWMHTWNEKGSWFVSSKLAIIFSHLIFEQLSFLFVILRCFPFSDCICGCVSFIFFLAFIAFNYTLTFPLGPGEMNSKVFFFAKLRSKLAGVISNYTFVFSFKCLFFCYSPLMVLVFSTIGVAVRCRFLVSGLMRSILCTHWCLL